MVEQDPNSVTTVIRRCSSRTRSHGERSHRKRKVVGGALSARRAAHSRSMTRRGKYCEKLMAYPVRRRRSTGGRDRYSGVIRRCSSIQHDEEEAIDAASCLERKYRAAIDRCEREVEEETRMGGRHGGVRCHKHGDDDEEGEAADSKKMGLDSGIEPGWNGREEVVTDRWMRATSRCEGTRGGGIGISQCKQAEGGRNSIDRENVLTINLSYSTRTAGRSRETTAN
ncbi:hypothetical protein C8R45DRAFT_940995 [Mycena sanguinolenta]|nr:hypothetical protein C8R45DRAFT_940995 [Mycena sanguinolenta]